MACSEWWPGRMILLTILCMQFQKSRVSAFPVGWSRNRVSIAFRALTSSASSEITDIGQPESLWESILDRFQGDFDNYQQVVKDRENGLLPREGGGHEHIHCCLVPVNHDSRLAAFYFDGQPGAIFRFRYYQLVPTDTSSPPHLSKSVDTMLYTLHPELDLQLRQCSDPVQWPGIFHNFTATATEHTAAVTLLEKCDVRWSWELDPVQHAYVAEHGNDDDTNADADDRTAMHAVMVYGSATVQSQMMPGQQILIKDQLSLWEDALWIHDRGYNTETGDYIYGNQRGVPYALQRVANIQDDHHVKAADATSTRAASTPSSPTTSAATTSYTVHRVVVNPALQWTLGPDYRNQQEYESKMAAIGGSSRPAGPPRK